MCQERGEGGWENIAGCIAAAQGLAVALLTIASRLDVRRDDYACRERPGCQCDPSLHCSEQRATLHNRAGEEGHCFHQHAEGGGLVTLLPWACPQVKLQTENRWRGEGAADGSAACLGLWAHVHREGGVRHLEHLRRKTERVSVAAPYGPNRATGDEP